MRIFREIVFYIFFVIGVFNVFSPLLDRYWSGVLTVISAGQL
jgi:hypothetical protein